MPMDVRTDICSCNFCIPAIPGGICRGAMDGKERRMYRMYGIPHGATDGGAAVLAVISTNGRDLLHWLLRSLPLVEMTGLVLIYEYSMSVSYPK
jgi:hypothetical protein